MKKFTRQFIVFLILALAAGPTFASVCSTMCLAQNSQASVVHEQMDMADMHCDECPKSTQNLDQDHQATQHADCSMAGCHMVQTLTPGAIAHTFIPDLSYLAPIYFNPLGISADLSPPLKPPA